MEYDEKLDCTRFCYWIKGGRVLTLCTQIFLPDTSIFELLLNTDMVKWKNSRFVK